MKDMPLLDHLEELRLRLFRVLFYYVVIAAFCGYFSKDIFNGLKSPLEGSLPNGSFFIATTALSGWFVFFKVALVSAAVLVVPLGLFEVLSFVTPGLKSNEKKSVLPSAIGMSIFFYGGLLFAYFAVLPLSLRFLIEIYQGSGVRFLPQIEDYLNFVLVTLFGFGLIFILPFLIFALISLGIVSAKTLASARRFIYVGAFVIGAILTPPDVASQLLMSIPFIFLFELGLLMGRLAAKP